MNTYNPVPHPRFPTASVCTDILFRLILAGEAGTAEQHPQNSAGADPECGLNGILPLSHSRVAP
jgi:hypothetical protein